MSDHTRHDLCLRPKDPHDWRWTFLKHVADGKSKAVAAALAGKSRQCVHEQLKKHDNFRRKYHHAKMSHVELAETKFKEIALNPTHLYNYPALVAYLKAYMPGLYNPKPKPEMQGISPESVALILNEVLKDPDQFEAAYVKVKALADEQRKKER